jgi:hypothetical protein
LFKAETVAPRLRSAKVALEHAIRRDRVGQRLEIRPDAAALLQQGILSSPVSARLQGVQKQLQKHFTADLVAHLLEQRSEIADLAKEGVLRDVRVAPKLQGVQRTLEHNLARSNLFHALQVRRKHTRTRVLVLTSDLGTLSQTRSCLTHLYLCCCFFFRPC